MVSREVLESCGIYYFVPVPGVHAIDLGPVLCCRAYLAFGLLRSRQKLTAKSHFTNIAAMNRGLEFDIDDAHQMLKDTKAKMCETLAQFAANQEDHRQPLDAKVSTIRDLIHFLGLMVPSHSQCLPITARLL